MPEPEGTRPDPPAPLIVIATNKFQHEMKLLEKRGKRMAKIAAVIEALRTHQKLHTKYCDHPLIGQWRGWRDCHIEPDWILIYKRNKGVLTLGRTGRHSDIF